MSILLTCLLIAVLLPIISKGPLAMAMIRAGGYNNRYPREQQKKLKGFGARAKAAHENSFEALIMFIPGALAAIALGQVGSVAETLAMLFIAARCGYIVCYWMDIHWLRSVFWALGFGVSVTLLAQTINFS